MLYFRFLLIILLLLFLILSNTINEKFTQNSFTKPTYWKNLGLNDKLIIYGKQLGKSHSIYADKYLLKKKIGKLNIKNLNFPKTIKVLPPNKELNLNELPNNCVIKSNCGQGDIIIIRNKSITKMISRGKKMKNYKEWYINATKTLNYRPEIEPHYKYIKPVVFVEEYLGGEINDYKMFVIQGKFVFCQMTFNRFKNLNFNNYDKDFNLLKFTYGKPNNCNKVNKPNKYLEMIDISEKISKFLGFEFLRIDLYCIKKKIYLGEITFVPNAAEKKYMIRPEKYDLQIGKLWI